MGVFMVFMVFMVSLRTLAFSSGCVLVFLACLLFWDSVWVSLPHLLLFVTLCVLGCLGGNALADRLLHGGPTGPAFIRAPLLFVLRASIWLAAVAAAWISGSALLFLYYWVR